MDADRDFRSWQERLRAAMAQWEGSGSDDGALLRGVPLAEAERWLARRPADIGPAEQDYVHASRALQGRTLRRLQALVAGLVVLLLVAVGLGVRSEQQRQHAVEQERLATSRQLATLTGHDGPVWAVTFSPDGRALATAGDDGSVRLWDVDVASWRQRLCDVAGRNLTTQEWDRALPGRAYEKTCPDRP